MGNSSKMLPGEKEKESEANLLFFSGKEPKAYPKGTSYKVAAFA